MTAENECAGLGFGTVQLGWADGISNRCDARHLSTSPRSSTVNRGAPSRTGHRGGLWRSGSRAQDICGAHSLLSHRHQDDRAQSGLNAVVARARQSVATHKRQPVEALLVHATGHLADNGAHELMITRRGA
ncbi:MAG TPA: hypothetical protein VJ476_03455 [Rhizomicrobium sp.]|nr:hypothetical protein [Rhizomicrobium sp.]